MEKMTSAVTDYLIAQHEAGAQALQLFDSWVGALSPEDYQSYVFPYTTRIIHEVMAATQVPLIHFGTNIPKQVLLSLEEAGCRAFGIDWCTPMADAIATFKDDTVLQGNLDPAALMAPQDVIEFKAQQILNQVGDRRGFIFNLGHGIHKETDPGKIKALTEFLHA